MGICKLKIWFDGSLFATRFVYSGTLGILTCAFNSFQRSHRDDESCAINKGEYLAFGRFDLIIRSHQIRLFPGIICIHDILNSDVSNYRFYQCSINVPPFIIIHQNYK